MKVLITGSHGYIGAVMAPLLQDGLVVARIDTYFYEGCSRSVGHSFREVRGARPRPARIAWLRRGCASGCPFERFPGGSQPAGRVTLTWRERSGSPGPQARVRVRRFVFASSCSMYGAADVSELVVEEAPLVPLTPYAESKARTEEGLAELADDDFSSVFMRHATSYGVSPRLRADVVLNNLVPWAFRTQRKLGEDRRWRQVVDATP